MEALFYYVAVYAVTSIIACASFSLLCQDNGDHGDPLSCLEGAYYVRPVPSFILAASVLSLAGIPPLPGFLAKFLIFKSVIASGYLLPAVLAFLGSFMGVIYYLGIVFRLFKPAQGAVCPLNAPVLSQNWTWGGVVLGSLVLAVFMLFPDLFHRLLAVV